MRIANLGDRLVIVTDDGAIDVEAASDGRFACSPQAVLDRWDEFLEWAVQARPGGAAPYRVEDLGAPVPAPRQVFAIGLNYRDHAAESGLAVPDVFPPVFTKFRTALAGPHTTVRLPPGGHVDWEVELVVAIGRRAEHVDAADAWSHVAGLTVGQDLSERVSQLAGPAPQFSLGKSFPGFAPTGPWLVTPDEFDDLDDIELSCSLDGEQVQKGSTRDLVFSVPRLVEGLSAVLPLLPGDLIFTGTPAGVGLGRSPQRFVAAGQELVSHVAGVGRIRQRFVAG